MDVIGPHVMEGHFDLILTNRNGTIVLPSLWSDLVKPGSRIEMRMWPIEKPKPPRRPRSSLPPTTMPAPGMKPPPPPNSSVGQPPAANSERGTSPAPTKSPEPQPNGARTFHFSTGDTDYQRFNSGRDVDDIFSEFMRSNR